jgi:chromosome segregation ATPase
MQKPTIVLSTVLLASLISSGKVLAQNLPDEINHPQYLRVYQNLEQVLTTKTAELNKLTADKAALVAIISEMERDQVGLPARNSQLEQLINTKNQELAKLNADIAALDLILGQVGIDLNNLDAVINQLSLDLNNQNLSARQLEDQRKNARMVVAQIDVRLQRELREEDR